MGDITREKVRGYRARRKRAQRYTAAFLAFATLVGCGVGWSLRQTGISATAEAFCGAEEHTHTQECYEKVLICGLEEGETLPTEAPHEHTDSCYEEKLVAACAQEEHTHTDGCYAMQRNLTCTAQEHSHTDACYTLTGGSLVCAAQEHTHSDGCKDAEGNNVCGLSEHTHGDGCYSPVEKVLSCTLQEHTHGDSCYGPAQKTLICGHAEHTHTAECMKNEKVLACTLPTQQEPQEPHVHTDACYEEKLICGKTQHTHSELCFSNPAARETEEQWAAAAKNPGSGIWAIDLLGVASSQLGYEEVKENFILDENGAKKFYTRYGDSYGDPYGSWNGMFLAYCLKYAGVPEVVVPRRAGVAALLADMASSAHLKNPGEYDPQPGDIAVFGDRVGVIDEPGDPLTVICGNVDGKVAEIQVATASVSKYIQVAVAGAWGNQNDETLEGDTLTTVALENDTTTTLDLGEYTTSVTLSYGNPPQETEIIKGGSSPEITLSDGDAVKIYINYVFNAGVRTDSATYDMPDGIKTTDQLSGNVVNEQKEVVGTFIIDNGKINITYNESAWQGNSSHTGYVYFEGSVDLSDTNDKKEITFPGVGKITIDKKEEPKDYGYWLGKAVVKTEDGKTLQVQEDGFVKVTYKVTLTATGADGSGVDNLSITDILKWTQWGNDYLDASYVKSSFKLVKSGSDDDLLNKSGTTLTFGTDSEGNPQAKIENIPALGAKDESYILTYDVTVPADEFKGNDEKAIKNWVKTDDSHSAENTDAKKEYKLQKGSSYNSGTGRITWTVTVNNPLGPVNGYKVWDELPENLEGKVTSDITITDCNWQIVKTLTKDSPEFNNFFSETGYTFGDGSSKPPYKFTYETNAPEILDEQTEATAINTAKVTPKDEETITVTKEEKVDSGNWKTQKKRESVSGDMVYWSIQAENTLGSKHFTVTDTIKGASTDPNAWNATFYPGTHYALKSELEKAFKGGYSTDGKGLYVLLDDGQGNTEEVAYGSQRDDVTFAISYTKASETGAVTAFTIEVTSTDKKVKRIYLSAYPTHVDFSQTPDGSTWIFKNDLKVDKEQTSAAYSYTKFTDFKKEVSTDNGTTWSSKNGVTEDVTLDSVKYGILYRVVLSIEAGHSEDIVITDKLPDGAKFINSGYSCYVDGIVEWWFNGHPTYDETKNTVTFTITPQKPEKAHTIELRYKVDVTNDPDWEDTLIGSKNYRNVARWGDEEAETNTLVKRYNSDLAKEAEQLKDSNGEASNRIQYTVVINPNKKNLANGADSFTLEDTLTLGSITGSLDPSSFQLYYFKDVGGTLDLTNKAQIIKLNWAASNPNHFAVTVPNRTALVLRYIFEVNMSSVPPGTTTFDIFNAAKIGTNMSASKSISIADQKAGGGFNGDKLQLIKKDKDSGLLISGAQFSIQSYDETSQSWTAVWKGEIPDGQMDFGISETPSATTTVLRPGVLYSIQETKAPDNYKLDTTPKYVIFSPDTDNANVFQAAAGGDSITGTNKNDTVTASNVTFLANSGASTLEFENQYTQLDVKKEWRDKNNNVIEAPVNSITVQLKRYPTGQPDSKENVGAPVTLNKASNWAYSWTNLEQGYNYTVEEVLPEDWKVWTVSYVHNDGIQTGQIYITNVVSDEFTYELPRTGGSGTKNFVLFGAFAMILAGCGMIVTRKKHYTGVYER